MRLLLLSNSTNYGEEYLKWPKSHIKDFFGDNVKRILFIPFAGVTVSYDDYAELVGKPFRELGYEIDPIHIKPDPRAAIEQAEGIAVGGGNTFHLVYSLHKHGIMEPIRAKVAEGMPYAGWSAGSNVASPTLRTTNDMPIIEPDSFETFNLVPFQINPHYLDAHPEGHGGETREQRLNEFLEVNPDIYVCGLREGSAFRIEESHITLIGEKTMRLFKKGQEPEEYDSSRNLDFLLK